MNSENKDSFSEKSESSQQKETDFETESEKKNRLSLKNALISENYSYAFEKLNNNISYFCTNIQILLDYNLYLGSKLDNTEKGEEIDKIILKTADCISETFNLIEIIKNFEYSDRNQKIQNITKANQLEDECNKYKKFFDDLIDKINQKNINLIKQARSSFRYSNHSDFSLELHLSDEEPTNDIRFKNGKEFLYDIEMKKKQIDAIYLASQKIQRTKNRISLSKINIYNYDKDFKNESYKNIETFNVDYNIKKNDFQKNLILNKNNQNKITLNNNNTYDNADYQYINIKNISRTNSKIFHDMEDKVFLALEGQRQNFFRRHWIISSIILILIIIYIIL